MIISTISRTSYVGTDMLLRLRQHVKDVDPTSAESVSEVRIRLPDKAELYQIGPPERTILGFLAGWPFPFLL